MEKFEKIIEIIMILSRTLHVYDMMTQSNIVYIIILQHYY